jgi:hypothetical protein
MEEKRSPKVIRKKFCEVQNCSGYAINNEIKLCRRHLDMFYFFTWALTHIKVPKDIDEIRTKSGLIIPK